MADSQSKILKSTRQKSDRRRWLAEGLCTRCGKRPPKENRRRCDECSERGIMHMIDVRYRRTLLEDEDDREH